MLRGLLATLAAAGLTKLPEHAGTILSSTAACFILQHQVSPLLSSLLFPQTYPALPSKTKHDWDIRMVAFLHAIFATLAAAWMLNDPIIGEVIRSDKVFAYHPTAAAIFAISTGYFTWDLIISTLYIRSQGIGFFLHALVCFSVFVASFVPIFHYFGAVFLLWETSSIFLGIHWALDKMRLTGSVYQLVNGAVLLSTFGGIRLGWGSLTAWDFWAQLSRPDVRATLPTGLAKLYLVGLLCLQALNVYWFTQMIKAIRKRFNSSVKQSQKSA